MQIHHISSFYLDFSSLINGTKSHLHAPEADYKRGDRVHITDFGSGRQQVRDILTVDREFMYVPGFVGLGLLGPEMSALRQMGTTNELGRTSVIWVGDTRALKVGRHIRLHDDMDEWRIDSLWTALAPKDVPAMARIGFVQEIV